MDPYFLQEKTLLAHFYLSSSLCYTLFTRFTLSEQAMMFSNLFLFTAMNSLLFYTRKTTTQYPITATL